MKKFLIGSLVLSGLLIAASSGAKADEDGKLALAKVAALETRIGGIETALTAILTKLNGPIVQQEPVSSTVTLSATLDRYLADQRKARDERDLAEALQSLLNKARPHAHTHGYGCGCGVCAKPANAAPACEYVKPNCAPIHCQPAPCSVWQR